MVGKLLAFLIYVLILSLFCLCVYIFSKHTSKKYYNYFLKKYNEALIVDYIVSFYNNLINIEKINSASDLSPTANYLFHDIVQLYYELDTDNIDDIIKKIEIVEADNHTNMPFNSFDDLSDEMIDLLNTKNRLVIMILCHKCGVYNAEQLLANKDLEMERLSKYVPKKLKKIGFVYKILSIVYVFILFITKFVRRLFPKFADKNTDIQFSSYNSYYSKYENLQNFYNETSNDNFMKKDNVLICA